jgi:hypothetical protein
MVQNWKTKNFAAAIQGNNAGTFSTLTPEIDNSP